MHPAQASTHHGLEQYVAENLEMLLPKLKVSAHDEKEQRWT